MSRPAQPSQFRPFLGKPTLNHQVTQLAQLFQQGLVLHQQGQLGEARAIYESVLNTDPKHFDALHLIGVIFLQLKNYQTAADFMAKAIEINPNSAAAHINRGAALKELRQPDAAVASYNEAIRIKPDYAQAYYNRGLVFLDLKRWDEALESYDKALAFNPGYAEAYNNRGNVLVCLNQLEEALASYQRALTIKPDYAEAHYNQGNALVEHMRLNEALASYDRAISLEPNYAEAYNNRSNALRDLNRLNEALETCDIAIKIKPDYAEAYANRGNAMVGLKRLDEALLSYEIALSIKDDFDFLGGVVLSIQTMLCKWNDLENKINQHKTGISKFQKISLPFTALALFDNSELHRISSTIFSETKYPPRSSLGLIPERKLKDKIRLGYYSADFKEHAVAYLTAELFELHNKSKFEVIAFSLVKTAETKFKSRLTSSFDKFYEVHNKSDKEIATLSRDIGIDIAIDLGGHTKDARTGIFSYRAAPIQISYAGYLGTMGISYYDYIISDHILLPNEYSDNYAEKIVFLPCYQVNDSKRVISNKYFSKHELTLPEAAFVFCCFNNNYKILPSTFDGWMRVLKAVKGSVLFLLSDNQWAEANLKKEAELRGVSSARLVFGARLLRDDYLARYRACDLFLDTFPYNAGATASDALWAGLPVLTCTGHSFASRMAASLLTAIEMPELITHTQEDYEALAIELATNPSMLQKLKDKLKRNRLTTQLFDTELFTKHIEAAYEAMLMRSQAGLPPEHIVIKPMLPQ